MTKKIIAVFLCLIMAFGAAIPASAASFADALSKSVSIAADAIGNFADDDSDTINVPTSMFFTTIFRTIGNVFRGIAKKNPMVTGVTIKDGPKVTLKPDGTGATSKIYYFDSAVSSEQRVAGREFMPEKGDSGYVVVVTSDGFVSKATKVKYERKYTLTFNANGGVNPPPAMTCSGNTPLTPFTVMSNPDANKFLGWSTKKDDSQARYSTVGVVNVKQNMTLYAIWEYTLWYNGNAGYFMSSAGQDEGDELETTGAGIVKITNTIPVRDGYTFKGWSTKPTGGVEYRTGADYPIYQKKGGVLYAVWEEIPEFEYEEFTENGKTYKKLVKYNGSKVSVNIPEDVVEIKADAFRGNSTLRRISIATDPQANDIVIGAHAFDNCASLESITIGPVNATLGDSAFANCPKLNTVDFRYVRGINAGAEVFYNSGSRYSEMFIGIFESDFAVIKDLANSFSSATGNYNRLQNADVRVTGGSLLMGASFNSLHIGVNVREIGLDVFYGGVVQDLTFCSGKFDDGYYPGGYKEGYMPLCQRLIVVNAMQDEYFRVPDWLFAYNYVEGSNPLGLQRLYLIGVDSVGEYAFYGCEGLNEYTEGKFTNDGKIEIYNSDYSNCFGSLCVSKIGKSAFAHTGFTHLYIYDKLNMIEDAAFAGCDNLHGVFLNVNHDLAIPAEFYGEGIFGYSERGLNVYVIGSYIPTYIFYRAKIDDVIFCNNEGGFWSADGSDYTGINCVCTTIGLGAFRGSNIEHIEIPASVALIEDYAFYECPNLVEVEIFGSATIGESAFKNSSVERIFLFGEEYTLNGDIIYGITERVIYYPGSETDWADNVTIIGNVNYTDRVVFNCNS